MSPGMQGSSAIALLDLSSGGQAIAVHLAKVPELSQLQVLQSSLKTLPGVQVKPGSFTLGRASWQSKNQQIVRHIHLISTEAQGQLLIVLAKFRH